MSSNFKIDRIPEWLIIKTLTKMSPPAFVRFQRTNKKMNNLCNSRENLFCFPMVKLQFTCSSIHLFLYQRGPPVLRYEQVNEEIPYRIKCRELYFYEDAESSEIRIAEFVKLIRERQITCDSMKIGCDLTNIEEQVRWCIIAARPSRLSVIGDDDEYHFMARQIFPVSLFQNLTYLNIPESDYRNEDLLLVKAKVICMDKSNVTYYGINQLLRQWFENEREIEKVHLKWLETLSEDEIIQDLTVCVVYNKEWHQYSHLSHMDSSELPDDMPSFYHLIRAGDIDGMLRLWIDKTRVLIEPCNRQATYYHMGMIP